MMELIPNLPDHVVGVKATGRITADDYEQVLIPALEEKLRDHKKINLLYWIDEGFESFAPGAMWDDAKAGLGHLGAWGRVACVADVEWIRKAVGAFGFFWRGHIRIFTNGELKKARAWVCEPIEE